ncbi:hypothetical protein CN319_32130, partial [Bacillus cereus]
QRKPSKRALENEVLSEEIQKIFEEHKGRYGSLRITKVLEKKGIKVNRKRVGKLMCQMKLYAKGSRYRYKRYNKKSPSIERPNLLNQVFQTNQRNKIWVGDIAYIPTQKGTLYLAVFVDMYSRKVIGWSMSTRMKDSLVIDAFLQGYKKERGVSVHPTTIMRWVHEYGNLIYQIWKKKNKSAHHVWHLDETYIKVKGERRYLYRAIDR